MPVLVFAKGEKEKEALEAGADYAGAEDLIERIKGGWLDFDKAVATPDIMARWANSARPRPPGPDAQRQGGHCDLRSGESRQ